MFTGKITMSQAGIVCLFSLLVVFAVLFALVGIITLTAKLTHKEDKTAVREEKPAAEEAAVQKPKDDSQAVLIAAAVAAYLGTTNFVVCSVRTVSEPESGWERESLARQLH